MMRSLIRGLTTLVYRFGKWAYYWIQWHTLIRWSDTLSGETNKVCCFYHKIMYMRIRLCMKYEKKTQINDKPKSISTSHSMPSIVSKHLGQCDNIYCGCIKECWSKKAHATLTTCIIKWYNVHSNTIEKNTHAHKVGDLFIICECV